MKYLRFVEKGQGYDVDLMERVMFHSIFTGTLPMFFISLPFCFVVFLAFANPDGNHYYSEDDTSVTCRPVVMASLLISQGGLLLIQIFLQVAMLYVSFSRAHRIFGDVDEKRNVLRIAWTVFNLVINFFIYFFVNLITITFWVFFFLDKCVDEEYGKLMQAVLVFQQIYLFGVCCIVSIVTFLKINHKRASKIVKDYEQRQLDVAGGKK